MRSILRQHFELVSRFERETGDTAVNVKVNGILTTIIGERTSKTYRLRGMTYHEVNRRLLL